MDSGPMAPSMWVYSFLSLCIFEYIYFESIAMITHLFSEYGDSVGGDGGALSEHPFVLLLEPVRELVEDALRDEHLRGKTRGEWSLVVGHLQYMMNYLLKLDTYES